MTKVEAIKEIEKLTGITFYYGNGQFYEFKKGLEYLQILNKHYFNLVGTIKLELLEPLSKLIPILFNNDVDNSILTKQSKTIKEGE